MQPSSFSSSSSSPLSPSSTSSQRAPASSSSGPSSKASSKDDLKPKYLQFHKSPSLSLKFLAYSTGATLPSTIKKVTRKVPKHQHNVFDWVFSGQKTQLSWLLQPERHRKRCRKKRPPENDTHETDTNEMDKHDEDTHEEDIYKTGTHESGPQQPMFDFPSRVPRAPKLKERSRSTVPPPSSGHAGGSMVTPRHGHSRPFTFSHRIRSIVRPSRGTSMPLPSRK